MAESSIEWTDKVWNPVVGCSRVSAGCEHCYAERVAHRGMVEEHRGLTVLGKHGPRWTGEVRCLPERLDEPLRWRKPRSVFVNSMSDLFHESVPFDFIAAVFGVMAASQRHTFQVLTKRPERARAFFAWLLTEAQPHTDGGFPDDPEAHAWSAMVEAVFTRGDVDWPAWVGEEGEGLQDRWRESGESWPLPNVWLGVSVEDQATADERIPELLHCPAAVRWVSYEPALGPVDFDEWFRESALTCHYGESHSRHECDCVQTGLDWIIVGGESGPHARPFDLAWARSTIAQCRAAGVPVFMKQLGVRSFQTVAGREKAAGRDPAQYPGAWGVPAALDLRLPLRLSHRKGGDPSEWPEDLRVREEPSRG